MQCPFCTPEPRNLLYENGLIRILVDSYPANRGHLLVVPKRHVTRVEDLTWEEKLAIMKGVEKAMEALKKVLSPDGFNVGINIGKAAGQTVEHLHVHVIPRYRGDCNFPRGGVRKAVLDIEDENLSNKERWVRNRLSEQEIEMLQVAINELE
ncbi:HIT family protein [Pyrococcus kukulkanii]|uniref:HIT family hydrolase n=1 Tax=Pyrococcus kukulkanii TaxID=1609559 RepID=A0A127B9F6_9EURY|nr:HIT family protein [Pyrococcus kukulkanii]AMM54001.1 HIT family hydrolase [Pyrococcus kukulkanii]